MNFALPAFQLQCHATGGFVAAARNITWLFVALWNALFKHH